MRIVKSLRTDQEIIKRYLDVLGGGSVAIGSSKHAEPAFFINAHGFIAGYIEQSLFKKEEFLIKALEDNGFPANDGPVGFMRTDQRKGREAAALMITAANSWKSGDAAARSELSWAVSAFTSALRQHLERLKNLIIPLIEQTLSTEDEEKVAEQMNAVVLGPPAENSREKYIQQIAALEEELSDWR